MGKSKHKILFLAPLLLAGLFTFLLIQKNRSGDWVPLTESRITESIYGLATLESDETFRYRVGITSQILKLAVKEGVKVKKGELLLQLSEGATIQSPLDGVVTQLDAKEKETVFPGTNLITVMNLKKVALSITLEQSSAIRVREKLPVRIQFESLQGNPLEGIVRSVYPKDGQFVIKVDLKQIPISVLPGMTADTAIIVGEKKEALLAPIRAVQRGMLMVRKNGIKKKIRVNTGFQDSEHIEILGTTEEDHSILLKPGIEVWVSKS